MCLFYTYFFFPSGDGNTPTKRVKKNQFSRQTVKVTFGKTGLFFSYIYFLFLSAPPPSRVVVVPHFLSQQQQHPIHTIPNIFMKMSAFWGRPIDDDLRVVQQAEALHISILFLLVLFITHTPLPLLLLYFFF